MAFESLAYRYTFEIPDVPRRWLPLIHLYDPDLPLFPIYYFHVLPNPDTRRPSDTARAYGYVERINLSAQDVLSATVVSNKDLASPANTTFRVAVENEVRERLGIGDPVTRNDIIAPFTGPLAGSNAVLLEIWHRVVTNAYGDMLPFGRLWDEVLGLARFVSSWNSPSGRKGELIQTHYFASRFGVPIQSAGGIPQVDFFLLPTIHELQDPSDPLNSFPPYSELVEVASIIQTNYCDLVPIDTMRLSKFRRARGQGRFTAADMSDIAVGAFIPERLRPAATECFNAFDKGSQRPLIFLMMLDDIRQGRLDPVALTSGQCGSIYDGLDGTYQSPKVIAIYAQQSFGNPNAMPIDTWVETFMKWPLNVWPTTRGRGYYRHVYSNSQLLGKVERLIWVTAQSRKVHSSACNDALWCLKWGSNDRKMGPRGANPFACNICLDAIRRQCPAYGLIRDQRVSFNGEAVGAHFNIETSTRNNTAAGQTFIKCSGTSRYGPMLDEFSPDDDPHGFSQFPDARHPAGQLMTVDEFVAMY